MADQKLELASVNIRVADGAVVTFHSDTTTQPPFFSSSAPPGGPSSSSSSSSPSSMPAMASLALSGSSTSPSQNDTKTSPGGVVATAKLAPPPASAPASTAIAIPVDRDDSTGTVPVHLLSIPAVARRFECLLDGVDVRRSRGLDTNEAARRRARDGPNRLTPPPEKSEIIKYFAQYLDPFMIMLNLAGVLSCIAYGLDTEVPLNLYLGLVLFAVTLVSCTFAYIQEGRADAVMKAFTKLLPRQATVIRDGMEKHIAAEDIVVGDLVRVGGGDQIPADVRIIYCSECKVEMASLTGESEPVTMSVQSNELKMEEARNLLFNTCQCLEGDALGICYATGDRSLIGTIASLASRTVVAPTPLQKEMSTFVRRLSIFALVLGLVFLIIGLSRGKPFVSTFINGFIIVMVACVPQGLPVTVVSCLVIAARAMGQRNVFIKQLRSVETLGSCTMICTDKTGTLTQNKMSASHVWFDEVGHTANGVKGLPGQWMSESKIEAANAGYGTLRTLMNIAGTCNAARFEDARPLADTEADAMEAADVLANMDPSMTMRSARVTFPVLAQLDRQLTMRSAKAKFGMSPMLMDREKRKLLGDASDSALFRFVDSIHNVELMRYHWPSVFDVKFNSRSKFALSIVKPRRVHNYEPQRRRLLIKGAPEVILNRCTHVMRRGAVVPMDSDWQHHYDEAYQAFGGMGERVLGFAMFDLPAEFGPDKDVDYYSQETLNYPQGGYTFVGLISLIDPPKVSVPDAVAQCRSAGIGIAMVTGDHPLTAAAIARQVGIVTGNTRFAVAKARGKPAAEVDKFDSDITSLVVRGDELAAFTEDDWKRTMNFHEVVFARTTPAQKLDIVTHYQLLGHVVAVTGDGVNDSPALKKADIGIAMGISGSDVARNAADVVLMDDDFSSIVLAVKEGRTIFDNLAKTIVYTLTHLVPETVPVLLNLAFDYPIAISSIMILAIDIGTELAPAVSFAYEPSEADVMDRPPRNSKTDRLVTLNMAIYVNLIGGAIETIVSFVAFFMTFASHDVPIGDLWGAASDYFVSDSDPWVTSNGLVFSADQQTSMLVEGQTAYWATLTMSQVLHAYLCKTRTRSLWSHGIGNMTMNYGVLIEVALIMLIVFTPPFNTFFTSSSFPSEVWPWFLLSWAALFIVHEPRKAWVRAHQNGWVHKWLQW